MSRAGSRVCTGPRGGANIPDVVSVQRKRRFTARAGAAKQAAALVRRFVQSMSLDGQLREDGRLGDGVELHW